MTTTTTETKYSTIVEVRAMTEPKTDRYGRTYIGVKCIDVNTYETFWVNHFKPQPITRKAFYRLEMYGNYLVFAARVQKRA